MKTLIAAALLLASQTVCAATYTEKEVAFCTDLKETADIIYEKKQEGVSKSTMYKVTATTDVPEEFKARFYTIINAVYDDVTPDQMFDLCLEVTDEQQTKRKSSRVDL